MDHSQAPVLDALAAYHAEGQTPFTPPGHEQGRGADPRVREVLGEAVFRSDVLAISGLDDRTSSNGVLVRAQELTADAVGAQVEHVGGRARFEPRRALETCAGPIGLLAALLGAVALALALSRRSRR